MRSITCFIFACSLSWAAQSLQLGSGVTASTFFPDSAPFTRADQANASMQFEFRLHDITTPTGNRTIWQTNGQTFFCWVTSASDLICTNWFDSLDDNSSSVSLAGRTDVIVRVVRDIQKMQFWVEIQNIDGTGYASGQVRYISAAGNGPS